MHCQCLWLAAKIYNLQPSARLILNIYFSWSLPIFSLLRPLAAGSVEDTQWIDEYFFEAP